MRPKWSQPVTLAQFSSIRQTHEYGITFCGSSKTLTSKGRPCNAKPALHPNSAKSAGTPPAIALRRCGYADSPTNDVSKIRIDTSTAHATILRVRRDGHRSFGVFRPCSTQATRFFPKICSRSSLRLRRSARNGYRATPIYRSRGTSRSSARSTVTTPGPRCFTSTSAIRRPVGIGQLRPLQLLSRAAERGRPQDDPSSGRLDLVRAAFTSEAKAKWLDYDTRHMLTELDPKPDFVTVTTGTTLWDITQAFIPGDVKGTHLDDPKVQAAWANMVVDSTPSFYIEHLKRLRAQAIRPTSSPARCTSSKSSRIFSVRASTWARSTSRSAATAAGRWVAIRTTGWRCCGARRMAAARPSGAACAATSRFKRWPLVLGQHVRVGNEDNIWDAFGTPLGLRSNKWSGPSRPAEQFGRKVATAEEARQIMPGRRLVRQRRRDVVQGGTSAKPCGRPTRFSHVRNRWEAGRAAHRTDTRQRALTTFS